MKHPTSTIGPRLKRFAWMVALLVVLRFVAVDLHLALEHHEAGQDCEICLVAERAGDGVPAAAAKLPQAPGCAAPRSWRVATPAVASHPCPLPRGPPSLLS